MQFLIDTTWFFSSISSCHCSDFVTSLHLNPLGNGIVLLLFCPAISWSWKSWEKTWWRMESTTYTLMKERRGNFSCFLTYVILLKTQTLRRDSDWSSLGHMTVFGQGSLTVLPKLHERRWGSFSKDIQGALPQEGVRWQNCLWTGIIPCTCYIISKLTKHQQKPLIRSHQKRCSFTRWGNKLYLLISL